MQTNSPDTYMVTCSPALMTQAELDRAISQAEWRKRNADTDAQWAAYDARLDTLYNELDARR